MPGFYCLPFIKMQALGNDFIFLDGEKLLDSAARPLLSQWQSVAPILAKELCHRRLSIGADGLILAIDLAVPELSQMASAFYGTTSQNCQLSWTYHNSDGSMSDMCGNGLRCLALWAREEKNIDGELKVATALGPLSLSYEDKNNATVTLGAPRLLASEIPFLSKKNGKVIKELFELGNVKFPITCVNVGNPHCVIFEADFLNPNLFSQLTNTKDRPKDNFFPSTLTPIAEMLEVDNRFPEQTNIEFVNVLDRNHIQVFVWERGSKATLASGSCAVAAAVASVLENRTDRKVTVTLPGGTLLIDWSDENVIKMTGEADLSFYGQINISTEKLTSQDQGNKHAKVIVS
jgi:diaminopimelate epimerase